MKAFRLLGAVLFAALVVGVVAVASASAVEFLAAEWLIGGNPVTGKISVETSGGLLLEDTKAIAGAAASALCDGILDVSVGPGGEGEITELLNTKGELISTTVLTGLALEGPDCVNEVSCESPLMWAENLPWNTLAELMVEGTEEFFVGLLLKGAGQTGNPAWEIECMGIISATDLCEAEPEGIAQLLNLTEDVGAEFSEAFTTLAGIKLATCSLGGAETGVVESDTEGLITASGGTLQIFS